MAKPEIMEQAIVDRLAPVLAGLGIDVIPLPETTADFDKPVGAGRVVVAYHSSRYENEEDSKFRRQLAIGCVVQDQVIDFQIAVETRKLRGDAGKHAIIAAVIRSLLGWPPPDCGALFLVSDNYAGFQDNLWCHIVTLRCHGVMVQAPVPPDPPLATLTLVQEITTP